MTGIRGLDGGVAIPCSVIMSVLATVPFVGTVGVVDWTMWAGMALVGACDED